MLYNEFINHVKLSQSAFESTRKRSMEKLESFWNADRGLKFEKYIERMADDLSEAAHQRQRRNRWN